MSDRECKSSLNHLCWKFLQTLAHSVDNKSMCINIYDVRLDDTMPSCGMNWPPDIKPITTYLDVSSRLPRHMKWSSTAFESKAKRRCQSSPCGSPLWIMGWMSRPHSLRDPRKWIELIDHSSTPSSLKNPRASLCWRSGPNLQLCWDGSYHQSDDMEWWNWAWSRFTKGVLEVVVIKVLSRLFKRNLGM